MALRVQVWYSGQENTSPIREPDETFLVNSLEGLLGNSGFVLMGDDFSVNLPFSAMQKTVLTEEENE